MDILSMKPKNLKTKLFLDSGDPTETKELIQLMGFLDGQTTNPTLVAKNPNIQKRLANGEKFTSEEIYSFYKMLVTDLSTLIPDGSISIEVYADATTKKDEMLQQAGKMYAWIPNAHIKFPTNNEGLKALEQWSKDGKRANMTLCFTQEQSAAVYAASNHASNKSVLNNKFK